MKKLLYIIKMIIFVLKIEILSNIYNNIKIIKLIELFDN